MTTKLSNLIKSFETDPKLFIEVYAKRKLSNKQRDFVDSTRTHNHLLAIWSRQTGKSTVIASYIVWRFIYGKGKTINGEHMNEHIIVLAPIKDQVKNLYDKIRSIIDKTPYLSDFIEKFNQSGGLAKNGNKITFLSASPGSQIRGHTATCIVIDESQDITDNKYTADILPFGATTDALIIEAGTPKTKNHFYNSVINKNIKVVKQMWYECPFISKEYVMQQKSNSPEALWRQEYLCEFLEEGVMAFPSRLFEPESMDGLATGRWNLEEYNWIKQEKEFTKAVKDEVTELISNGALYTAGLDLGKMNDPTVYTIMRVDQRPIRVAVQIEFPLATKYSDIAKTIANFHQIYRPVDFNFDYSNEKGFAEHLIQNNVNYAKEKDGHGAIVFTNRNKEEMVSNAVILLENYQLQLPTEAEKLQAQFMNQQYETNAMMMKVYYHPTNEHDDRLWSTLLAIKNIRTIVGENIIPKDSTKADVWKTYEEKIHRETDDKKTREISAAGGFGKYANRKERYVRADFRRGGAMRM